MLLELRAVPVACCVHASLVMKVLTAVTVKMDTLKHKTTLAKVWQYIACLFKKSSDTTMI